MHWKKVPRSYDYLLALAVIALGVFGVVMIYSATYADSVVLYLRQPIGGLWNRQVLFVATGSVLMIGFSMIDYHLITRFFLYAYGLMMVLLVAILIPGVGVDMGANVARSLPVLPGVTILPSEVAKLLIIVFLAKFLDILRDRFNKPQWIALVVFLIVTPVVLIFLQPSFSASIVVLCISFAIVFIAGLHWKNILVGTAVLTPLAVVIWFDVQRAAPIIITRFLSARQVTRIQSLIHPEYATEAARFQTEYSLRAIGSGGLTGLGFMENSYVPLGFNDFIFSVTASQFGFVGAAVLLGVVGLVIVRCIQIALKAADFEGRLIAAGVAAMLLVETFFHVGVATDILPNTGVPFPFMSYGGSMIWAHMTAIGIVLNIGLPRKPKSMFESQEEDET
jgi:rod shape determining protein RodA